MREKDVGNAENYEKKIYIGKKEDISDGKR